VVRGIGKAGGLSWSEGEGEETFSWSSSREEGRRASRGRGYGGTQGMEEVDTYIVSSLSIGSHLRLL
jgi:hypothetical protein